MSKEAFDKKIDALEALRLEPDSPTTVDRVRKGLRDRSNYLVSKAAAIAADLQLSPLIPDLLAAFDRFFIDPVKSDPQCWAKNAIARALRDLEHRDAEVYLRGIVHIQLEPVWGGRADSAATLRGTSALALVACPLDDLEILRHLGDGLADSEKTVRIDVATAISQLARPEGALLLRLKVLLGDSEPEVIGECLSGLLRLTPRESVQFVGRLLKASDEDVRMEAAAALAQSREPEAIEILKACWRNRLSPDLRSACLTALGASPLPEAGAFLLSIISDESDELAARALAVLAVSRFCAELRDRTAAAVKEKGSPSLQLLFEQKFPRRDDS